MKSVGNLRGKVSPLKALFSYRMNFLISQTGVSGMNPNKKTMKKQVLPVLLILLVFYFAQNMSAQHLGNNKFTVSPGQLIPTKAQNPQKTPSLFEEGGYLSKKKTETRSSNEDLPKGIQALNAVPMGRASNVFSGTNTFQNQVVANDSLNLVGFIHRQDVSIWGGGSSQNGILRYDLSLDKGGTFTSDIGLLNPVYTAPSRSPNMSLYNPTGSTNPTAARFAYVAPITSVSQGFDGYLSGSSNVSTTSITSIETYHNSTSYNLIGSLVERVSGEFWAIAPGFDGLDFTDSIFVFKGTFNNTTQDIDWVTAHTLTLPYDLTFDGDVHLIQPQISFSPDGTIGWIGLLGDIVGGPQHVLSPIFIQSSNGGTSWGSPVEVNLNAQSFVTDSLQSLWVHNNGTIPYSTGQATATFEFDLTVDMDGNPHLFTILGSAGTQDSLGIPNTIPTYSVFAGLAKFAADITSTNVGASFQVDYVAPVLAFRGEHGTPSPATGDLLTIDNFPQTSRSEDGEYIFYSWVDSDTVITGFGEADNLAPNLRISGKRVSDGYRTCYKLISDGDFIWEGRMLFPTMAPTVLSKVSGGFDLPIVGAEMIINDQLGPCQYYYFGNDCNFHPVEFVDPTTIGLAWGSNCTQPNYAEVEGVVFNDANNNGIKDLTESGLVNRIVQLQPGNRYATTDSTGYYKIRTNSYGNFTVDLVPLPYWIQTVPTNPNTYAVTLFAPLQLESNKDFALYAPAPITDDQVHLLCGPVRPGRLSNLVLSYQNIGTVPSSGTIELVYDSVYTFDQANPTQSNHTPATRTLTWTYTNLQPQAFANIQVIFNTDTSVAVGTPVTNYVHLSTTSAIDEDTTNNYDTCTVLVTAAYDPNDKAVMPAGEGAAHRVDPDTELEYLIRFQNTGNDTAFYVRVEDQLDPDLDPATFRMLGTSHTFSYSIQGSGLVKWVFDPIELPDSGRDEPNSHGYIKFRIQPRPGLELGTEVKNEASIFFDFNSPVVTNQTLTTYDLVQFITPPKIVNGLQLFPNPSSGEVVLALPDWKGESYEVSIMNMQGQQVRTLSHLQTERITLQRDGLPAGIYLITVKQNGRILNSAKLIWMN